MCLLLFADADGSKVVFSVFCAVLDTATVTVGFRGWDEAVGSWVRGGLA